MQPFLQAFLCLSIFAQAACLHKNYTTSRSVRRVFFQYTHQDHQIKDTETQSIDISAKFHFGMISSWGNRADYCIMNDYEILYELCLIMHIEFFITLKLFEKMQEIIKAMSA